MVLYYAPYDPVVHRRVAMHQNVPDGDLLRLVRGGVCAAPGSRREPAGRLSSRHGIADRNPAGRVTADPLRPRLAGHPRRVALGARAAASIVELAAHLPALTDEERALLAYACTRHSDGLRQADVTVQVCWDADRLDLGRVGLVPDPDRLCTSAARDRQLIRDAYSRSIGG